MKPFRKEHRDAANAAVFVDGQLSASVEAMNEITGFVKLRASDGALEFRHLGVALADATPSGSMSPERMRCGA